MSRQYRTNHDDVYKVGDIVRYDSGSTALMRITEVYPTHAGGPRYYGVQCMGGLTGRYHDQCEPASQADLAEWDGNAKWRRETEARLFWDRHPVDILVDLAPGALDPDRVEELRRYCDQLVVPPECVPR